MKKYIIILVSLVALWGEWSMAAGPINFVNATVIKSLKKSVEYPITLYKTTDGAHPVVNPLFTERVIARLDNAGLSQYEQEAIRNEICASARIQTTNVGAAFNTIPAAIGIYEHNGNIVAIHDNGFLGENLTSALMKLKTSSVADKVAIAASFAAEMKRLILLIHNDNIIWNNANLSNFYVQPDGTLMAYDLSAAKNNPGGIDTPEKIKERNEFVANALRTMYQILFPAAGQANAEDAYAQFTALAGIGGAWRAAPMNQLTFNGIAGGAALPPAYRPGVDGELVAKTALLRANHIPAAGAGATVALNMGAATGFVLDAAVIPFFTIPVGTPPVVPTNLVTLCNGW